MRTPRSEIGAALVCAFAFAAFAAFAVFAPRTAAAGESPDVIEAREQFVRGTEAGKRAQWAEALAAFERSAKLRPHPVTTFNIGVCQRAMGTYTLARDTLVSALAQNEAAGGKELAESLVTDGKAFITQIDELLAKANVTIEPATASVTVDGRPLAGRGDGADQIMIAGVRPPGHGEPAPSKTFRLLLNPGAHIITISRPGFVEAVVSRAMAPGSTTELKLELDRLPAMVHVSSNQDGAEVRIDNRDVGVVPIDVSRPAGSYRFTVSKPGFKPYETTVSVQPGQELSLSAALAKEEASILTRWWFWTIAGAVVAGAGVGTYALTRGESTVQEPLDGGGLGWAVKLR